MSICQHAIEIVVIIILLSWLTEILVPGPLIMRSTVHRQRRSEQQQHTVSVLCSYSVSQSTNQMNKAITLMMNATIEPVHGLPATGLMSVRQRIRIVKIQDTKGCRQWHQLYFSSGWSPLPQRPGSPCRQTRSTSCQWTPAPSRSSTSCRSLNSWREPWVGCSPISSSSLTPTSGSGCQEAHGVSHKYALGDAW